MTLDSKDPLIRKSSKLEEAAGRAGAHLQWINGPRVFPLILLFGGLLLASSEITCDGDQAVESETIEEPKTWLDRIDKAL